jgi:DnaJ family protein C protein 2
MGVILCFISCLLTLLLPRLVSLHVVSVHSHSISVAAQSAGHSMVSVQAASDAENNSLIKKWFTAEGVAATAAAAAAAASAAADAAAADAALKGNAKAAKTVDLFAVDDIMKVTYYQILGLPMDCDPIAAKTAYHRACLKYHPDKTGRGEEDPVFLLVKQAFDTLSKTDKKRSYDSQMDFDERIPEGGEPAKKFYKIYGPVFVRNNRFAVTDDAPTKMTSKKKITAKSNTKKKGNKKDSEVAKVKFVAPTIGDENTPIEEVNAFYQYWTHFESWRDFTLKASKEVDKDPDSAEGRNEKRWMKTQIERKAKSMKKADMQRVNLLVERAMENDPRLKAHKEESKRIRDAEIKAKADEKYARENSVKIAAEAEAAAAAAAALASKGAQVSAKAQKDAEKKLMRKVKNQFRKLTMAGHTAAKAAGKESWASLEAMEDDVEFLCEKMSLATLPVLNGVLGDDEANATALVAGLPKIINTAAETRAGVEQTWMNAEAEKIAAKQAGAIAEKKEQMLKK